LGKTVTFKRPDDCPPIALAASINRSVRGWVSGVLTPSLNSNSAAALAGLLRIVAAQAAEADPSKSLRVIFIFVVSQRLGAPASSFGRTAGVRKVRDSAGSGSGPRCPRLPYFLPTKPFWGTRETILKHGRRTSVANDTASKTPRGLT